MSAVPLAHVQIFAAILFAIGLVGLLARRSVLFMLISIEVMLNAAGVLFIGGSSVHGNADGKAMFVFILVMAAAEVSVGLALVLRLRDELGTLDTDRADGMRG